MARTMTIVISPRENGEENNKKGQKVNFINIFDTYQTAVSIPQKVLYENAYMTDVIAQLNYVPYHFFTTKDSEGNEIEADWIGKNLEYQYGYTPIRSSEGMSVTIFKQEIGFNSLGEEVALSGMTLVASNLSNFHVKDYNVTNNRKYRYTIYPASLDSSSLTSQSSIVQTGWQGWSITELHPVDATMKNFTVSSDDVWIFNLNVETGEQVQNILFNEQQTLGIYPRFTKARQNFISGNVSCLLGEMLPANFVQNYRIVDGQKTRGGLINTGGYQERLPFSSQISSNDKVDMLLAWRRVVHSGNPKLLKDRKGQSFLIVIKENSNKPMDNVPRQPDTISFSWTQIGTLDDVQILDTSVKGGKVVYDS